MGGGGKNAGRVRLPCSAAMLLAIGLGMLAGTARPAEEPVDGKRLLLLYGTRRVEYVPDGPSSASGEAGPRNRLVLIGGEHLGQGVDGESVTPAGSPEGDAPVMPLPPVDSTARGAAESPASSRSLPPGAPPVPGKPPAPPEPNPLRYPLAVFPATPAYAAPALAPLSAFPNPPYSIRLPGWEGPLAGPPASSPNAPQPGRLNTPSPASRESSESDIRTAPDSARRDWLVAGAAQAAGTLVGLLLGGLVCLVVFLLIRDRREVKFEPTIRLELPPLAGPAGADPLVAVGGYGPGDRCLRVVETPQAGRTPVADFRDDVIPFDLSALGSRQRAEEAAKNRARQEKLLRQVYEDNLTLRQAIAKKKHVE